MNMGTSHKNPITWNKYIQQALIYFETQPFDQQAFPIDVRFIKNKQLFTTLFYLRSEIPARLYSKVASLPLIGSASRKKNAERLNKLNSRSWDLGTLFEHFTFNQWIFESNSLDTLISQMTPEDVQVFPFDPKALDWPMAIRLYMFGI